MQRAGPYTGGGGGFEGVRTNPPLVLSHTSSSPVVRLELDARDYVSGHGVNRMGCNN